MLSEACDIESDPRRCGLGDPKRVSIPSSQALCCRCSCRAQYSYPTGKRAPWVYRQRDIIKVETQAPRDTGLQDLLDRFQSMVGGVNTRPRCGTEYKTFRAAPCRHPDEAYSELRQAGVRLCVCGRTAASKRAGRDQPIRDRKGGFWRQIKPGDPARRTPRCSLLYRCGIASGAQCVFFLRYFKGPKAHRPPQIPEPALLRVLRSHSPPRLSAAQENGE